MLYFNVRLAQIDISLIIHYIQWKKLKSDKIYLSKAIDKFYSYLLINNILL